MKTFAFLPAAFAALVIVAGPAAAETTTIIKKHGMDGSKVIIKKHRHMDEDGARKVIIKKHVD
jgi:hypothetical protein